MRTHCSTPPFPLSMRAHYLNGPLYLNGIDRQKFEEFITNRTFFDKVLIEKNKNYFEEIINSSINDFLFVVLNEMSLIRRQLISDLNQTLDSFV